MKRRAGRSERSVLAMCMLVGPWLVAGLCRGEEPSEEQLISRITTGLAGEPRRDLRCLDKDYYALFHGASRSKLLRLADHANWHIAMQARWELRRFLGQEPFSPSDRYYPVAFLEAKGLAVPAEWATRLAGEYWRPGEAQANSQRYYKERLKADDKIAGIGPRRALYEKFYQSCVPQGTTITVSSGHFVIRQGTKTAKVERPLIRQKCNFFQAFAGPGDPLMVPLVGDCRTFVLLSPTKCTPYILACFDSRTGAYAWETLGWSSLPRDVWRDSSFVPSELGGPGATNSHTCSKAEERNGGPNMYDDMYSIYATSTGEVVAVLGHAYPSLFYVEAYSAIDGKCLLRFSTHSWDFTKDELDDDPTP